MDKSYPQERAEAEAVAEMAAAKVRGKDIQFEALASDRGDSPTDKDIPAQLVPVVALTKSNIESTVIQDSIYKVSDICTGKFKSACDAAELK